MQSKAMWRTGPVEHSNVGQGFLHSGVAHWYGMEKRWRGVVQRWPGAAEYSIGDGFAKYRDDLQRLGMARRSYVLKKQGRGTAGICGAPALKGLAHQRHGSVTRGSGMAAAWQREAWQRHCMGFAGHRGATAKAKHGAAGYKYVETVYYCSMVRKRNWNPRQLHGRVILGSGGVLRCSVSYTPKQ